MEDVALECRDLAKAFGGVPVLKGVSLTLRAGSVTALAGENGAGKSTMMKIASGQLKPDRGQVLIDGEPLPQADPQAAHRQGVAIIPQELAPIMDMRVYENLFIGRELRNRAGLLDRRAMVRRAREILDVFGVEIDPQATMRQLPVGLRQLVEIAKSTSGGAAGRSSIWRHRRPALRWTSTPPTAPPSSAWSACRRCSPPNGPAGE